MPTYRTDPYGIKHDVDGNVLNPVLTPLIRVATLTLTGTQLQNAGTASSTYQIVAAPGAGYSVLPIAWFVSFDHAGGTNFSVEDDIVLCDSTGVVILGDATGAITGSTDLYTQGDINTTQTLDNMAVYALTANGSTVGDPTGGHAGASAKITLIYAVIDNTAS